MIEQCFVLMIDYGRVTTFVVDEFHKPGEEFLCSHNVKDAKKFSDEDSARDYAMNRRNHYPYTDPPAEYDIIKVTFERVGVVPAADCV